RLRPDAGETHLARARLCIDYRDYNGALAELEVARGSLPNDSHVVAAMASVQGLKGRWEESIRNFERAIELDPRNIITLFQTGLNYGGVRRYAEQKSKFDRVLTIDPNNLAVKAQREFVEVNWKADTRPLHQLIDEIRATDPAAMQKIADWWLVCALAERDVA